MIRLAVLVSLLAVASGSAAAEPATLPRGAIFFAADFKGADALKGWSGIGKLASTPRGQALLIERSAGTVGSATMQIAIPVEKMRGYLVRFSALVKAENVSNKPQSWNGIKFMAATAAPEGNLWPQAEIGTGTFDWRPVGFQFRVPDDATQVRLTLGLEQVSGRAWYDDIQVRVWKPPVKEGPAPTPGPVFTGHSLPRLRGAMVSPNATEEDLRVLGRDWNANLIRWQLIRSGRIDDPLDLNAYNAWLESALKRLDAALPWCERYGLMVVVDLHSPPGGQKTSGGYAGSDNGLFTDAACQKRFVQLWQEIARRYRDSKPIWGYDLANEPVESFGGADLADWQELADRAARAVRAIDPHRAIIVEPPQWGSPSGLKELVPLQVPGVVYSVHMYMPGEFTHQGVHRKGPPVAYPGKIAGRLWDKAQVQRALQPVVDFQKRYNVHIFVGEFSAIRWAPEGSACRYLTDLIDVFEANGWDWTYHAFREWNGWSVEHGSDPENAVPVSTPTDRQRLLQEWFAKNKKPG
jgi:endoglucanase